MHHISQNVVDNLRWETAMMNFGRRTGRFLRVLAGALLIVSGILIPGEVGFFVVGIGALAIGLGLIEMA